MTNVYGTFAASTEQHALTRLHVFLTTRAGWYLNYLHNDSSVDREMTFVSEGTGPDCPIVYINIQATSNYFRYTIYQEENGATGTASGSILDSTSLMHSNIPAPGRCRVFANKKRIVFHTESSTTLFKSSCAGMLDSFYDYADDVFPAIVKVANSDDHDWFTSTSVFWFNRAVYNDTVSADLLALPLWVNEGAPNPRSGEHALGRPIIYYDGLSASYEVRGRMSGIYQGSPGRLANGSVLDVDGDKYMALQSAGERDLVLVGPLTDDGSVPTSIIQGGFPNVADYSVDYTKRGFENTVSTVALWRFDTDDSTYIRTSGSAYSVPALFEDTAGNYDLVPQNSPTLTRSWLQEAVTLDGATQYATVSGSTAAGNALVGGCTVEIMFNPDTIPVAGGDTILEYGVAGSALEPDNILFSVSISPIAGTSPDEYDRGNITVSWEKDAGTSVSSTTTSDFVFATRWNYIALVKKSNGVNYDVEVWHCSFGDYKTPQLKAVLTGMDNATGGTNAFWYAGANAAATSFFDGKLDDTRITGAVLSQEEIVSSCSRAVL